MDKIMIELFVPAVNQHYDVFIPLYGKLYEIEQLLTRAIVDLSEGYFAAAADTVLCDRVSGSVLDVKLTAQEAGLQNGSKLLLL
ncbi:methyltransferase [Paenibacillus athensensis]|uniref:Methyltransferase n=1 Tax=Paenibacillus athensensis TaxID=1967502 RepID=A0A4Y8Q965_9BACL|nr:methyltransferase [Paenibacillus athensensis]MCD1257392.1 methyltransferase [Paenibacillus athensensis]